MEQEITLRDVANYLDNIGIQFLATIGLDGKPKVRPMQYWYQERQIAIFSRNNPYFQILYNENDFGKAIFKDENADTNIVSGATVFTKDDMYEYIECLGKCKDEYGDDYVSDSYDNYTGPSCDDSYMDALDGEPDAYWNID